MHNYHDWLLMRELVLSLIFVLLVCVSIFMGIRSRRKQASDPDTGNMVDQDLSALGPREASATSALLRTEESPYTPRRAA